VPVTALDRADTDGRANVDALLERAGLATGHPPMSEPSLLARDAYDEVLGLVVGSAGRLLGYAQVGWRDTSFTVEIVVDPDRSDTGPARMALLDTAVTTARDRGATDLRYWATQHQPDDDVGPHALGFATERNLLQLRVPLPLVVERPKLDARFSLRAFRPGRDEAAWLEVNNRAFETHPEQGHWELETLIAREQTKWFDPEGFVLCESDGALAGSCWTKVHADRSPALGEIYVISVDPSFQSLGLGRVLAVAGLDWLAERVQVGMLYVDESNTGAVELYRKLGFSLDHVDRCYLLTQL
jgi:mycothiol synthase